MHASYLSSPGSSLTYGELPTPVLTPDHARIKVLSCGINHLDVLIRQGKRPGIPSYPHVLGSEIIGVIEEISRQVTGTGPILTEDFDVGDTVTVYPWTFCGECEQCRNGNEQICDSGGTFGRTIWGGYADGVIVPVRNLQIVPASLPVDEVCSLILAGTTAQHLIERSGVSNCGTVLVTGATGGVGTILVQLLKSMECTVIAATSHPEKSQLLKQIGVDYVISTASMGDNVRTISLGGADVVFDIVGGDIWSEALKALKKNGTITFCSTSREENGLVPVGMAFSNQWNILGSYGGSRLHLRQIMEKYGNGTVKPIIHGVHPLSDAKKAHEQIESQAIFGKILLKP